MLPIPVTMIDYELAHTTVYYSVFACEEAGAIVLQGATSINLR